MKTVIYARVSTETQEERNQITECQKLAKRLGFSSPDIIQEKISAFKNPERSTIKKLTKFDVVIVWSYDRLHRNRKKFVDLMNYFRSLNKKIYSVRESWLEELYNIPPPFDEIITGLMIQIVGWMAEDESKKRSERVKMAFKNKTKPWGRHEKKVDLNRLLICSGNSLRKTAEDYNRGLPKKDHISYITVKRLKDAGKL